MSDEVDPIAMLEPAATRVRDPVTGRSVWLANMVQNPRRKGEDLVYDLHFSQEHDLQSRQAIPQAIEGNLRQLGFGGKVYAMPAGAPPRMGSAPPREKRSDGGDPVKGMSGPGMGPHGGPVKKKPIPGVKHVIAVASGKGGVGKSTVSSNLATALARAGFSVGLLDADIYGPSVPTMMGADQRPLVDPESRRILPVMAHGVRCLSMGNLVDPEEAMIWRGPMVMSAVRQFLQDADWSDIDYLIIDLPPGTGDAQLTLIQAVDLSGAIIVTTPQEVALADAIRGITMFRKLEVPLLGVVENMAWYELPDGTRDHVFGRDGGKHVAERYETELLVQIPLKSALRESADVGAPAALGESPIGESFAELARKVADKVPLGEPGS